MCFRDIKRVSLATLTNTVRSYVHAHDLRLAKRTYLAVVAPVYRLLSVPLYDITASMKYHYTWFRIPKNGTHSIMAVLQTQAPADINSSYVPYFRRKHAGHFKFCVIRNPWDRLVSVYCNKVKMRLMFRECWGRDFAYFIEFVSRQNLQTCDAHLRRQTSMFPATDIDYVARMETFESDMHHVFETLGIHSDVVHAGKVRHPDYHTFFDPSLAERAGKMYATDVKFGNYTF